MSSLRRAAQAFNSYEEDGRVTAVLLHLQHAFEMLLKAALVERGYPIFDVKTGRSIGFEKCLNVACEKVPLTPSVTGTLRTIDAMRDDEQHYIGCDDEALLYLHVRAGVTAFDDVLTTVFGEHLANSLPARVLPIATEAPQDFDLLIDRQFSQIRSLLQPGRRRRAEAQRKIRTLLALEGHVAEIVGVSERDVTRVERGVRAGRSLAEIFPRLMGLTTSVEGQGLTVRVRISRHEGPPIRLVDADAPVDAAAIREVDLERTFSLPAHRLAELLKITSPKATALRWYLNIDADPRACHTFVHGGTRVTMWSERALSLMRSALADVDLNAVWRAWRARPRGEASVRAGESAAATEVP